MKKSAKIISVEPDPPLLSTQEPIPKAVQSPKLSFFSWFKFVSLWKCALSALLTEPQIWVAQTPFCLFLPSRIKLDWRCCWTVHHILHLELQKSVQSEELQKVEVNYRRVFCFGSILGSWRTFSFGPTSSVKGLYCSFVCLNIMPCC